MASASYVPTSTKETTNYARLCRVLVDLGTCALRDCFDAVFTPPTLHKVLAASQPTLQSLRSRRIINVTQWGNLFPSTPASVSSTDFDITLLMILFRNICGMAPPLTGWDVLPAATDVSREADIARIKYFRNSIYAHADHASIDDATFDKCWKEIRDTLVRLGGVKYKDSVDFFEVCCMDPDMQQHYRELLHQWKSDEDNIKDELKQIVTNMKEFGTGIKEVSSDVKEIGIDVKILTKKLDDLVASTVISASETNEEANGFKPKEILDISLMCREKLHENKLLTSFCKQCKVCICDKCRQTRHNNHMTMDIHQAAEESKVDIEEIVEDMKKEIADYNERKEKTNDSLRERREKIATARNKVMTSVEELVRLLHEHEKAIITSLDVIDGKEQREHAAQLEHFQISMNQLQQHVEWCQGILQRKKSVEILKEHHALIGRCRGLLSAEKRNIYKPSHVRYQINEEHVDIVRSAAPAVGRIVVSSTDALQSVAEGTGLRKGEVGSEATITIKTKDFDEKQCYDKNDQIQVIVQSPSKEVVRHIIARGEDGDYSVTYTPDSVGQHEVQIAVNGQSLTGSPWRVHVTPYHYKYSFSFGSLGKGRGQLDWPNSIAIDDTSGNVAVADSNGVHLFSSEGTHLRDIGTNKLTGATSVAFKSSDLLVIASDKIFCFNAGSYKSVKYVTNKHLKTPHCLTIAPNGCMVVCDEGDLTVKVLSSDGSRLLHTINDPGCANPRFALCHQKMIFVSYYLESDVKVFSKNGKFLHSICNPESGVPAGFAIDKFNNLVVCDRWKSDGFHIFTLKGEFVNTIEGQHTELSAPRSVAVSSTGQLFVTDVNKNYVYVFQ